MVPLTWPPIVNSSATTSPSICAPSAITTVEARTSPSTWPKIVRAPWPIILPTIERPELMEETSAEDATAERGIFCTDPESRWLSAVLLWGFPNISLSYSLLAWKLVSEGIVDAVEAGAETAEYFAPSRFRCGCEFIDADLRANERSHLADARSRRI